MVIEAFCEQCGVAQVSSSGLKMVQTPISKGGGFKVIFTFYPDSSGIDPI